MSFGFGTTIYLLIMTLVTPAAHRIRLRLSTVITRRACSNAALQFNLMEIIMALLRVTLKKGIKREDIPPMEHAALMIDENIRNVLATITDFDYSKLTPELIIQYCGTEVKGTKKQKEYTMKLLKSVCTILKRYDVKLVPESMRDSHIYSKKEREEKKRLMNANLIIVNAQ